MKKHHSGLLIICLFCAGCAAAPFAGSLASFFPSFTGGQAQAIQSTTLVQLSSENYRILKKNVVGTDWGINFLGIIPIVPLSYAKAIGKLYESGEITEGKPLALINIFQQRSSLYFVLFSIPAIAFRADVVEFSKSNPSSIP